MEQYNQMPQDPKPTKPENKSTKIFLIAILVLAIIVFIASVVYVSYKNGPSNNDDDNNSFVTMIPIWIAVFIPIIAAGKKEKTSKTSPKNKKFIISLLVAVTIGMVIGTIILWAVNS